MEGKRGQEQSLLETVTWGLVVVMKHCHAGTDSGVGIGWNITTLEKGRSQWKERVWA